jgi:N,N'-diacetyllegionaminate synthase
MTMGKGFNQEQTKPSVFIIAEAGVNHNGDLATAMKLVDAAVKSGANAVKFQTFHTEELVAPDSKTASHQKRSQEENQFTMLKNLELTEDDFRTLKTYCDTKHIEFISTPYDVGSVAFLNDLGVNRFKIASAEIVNKPVIEAVALTKKPIFLATGMAILGEIERTLSVFRGYGSRDITLLHCTTSYPTPYDQVHLWVMKTLERAFGLPVGYSDHTLGIEIAIMAVSLGATVIEKHFTLDRAMVGPDHYTSLEPDEFKTMVTALRHVEQAFGNGEKTRTDEEEKNIRFMRRSIHAARDISEGERIEHVDIVMLRENDGLSPWESDMVIGRIARKNIKKYQPITWGDI